MKTVIAIIAFLLTGTLCFTESTEASLSRDCRGRSYLAGILLVKFRQQMELSTGRSYDSTLTGIAALDSLNRRYECISMKRLHAPNAGRNSLAKEMGFDRIFELKFPVGISETDIEDAYRRTGLFEYVEKDRPTYSQMQTQRASGFIPNDKYFNRQWALHNDATFTMGGRFTPKIDADIDMPEAWEMEQGDSAVIIGLLDSGCKMNHPELAGRFWVNPREIPGNGIDDDGNGFVDDVNGWDFLQNDNDPTDETGHGTFMAGLIAAKSNNNSGYAGVNQRSKILVCRVKAGKDGTGSNLAKGMKYLADLRPQVINISLSTDTLSRTVSDAIKYAFASGVLIVAGSGNAGTGVNPLAAMPECLAVGATGPDDKWADHFEQGGWSNFGPELDLVAPGTFNFSLDLVDTVFSTYGNGTSNSAAFVTGVASLLFSQRPGRTANAVRELLIASVDDKVGDPMQDIPGWDQYHGWGRLNARKALELGNVEVIRNSVASKMPLTENKTLFIAVRDDAGRRSVNYIAQNSSVISIAGRAIQAPRKNAFAAQCFVRRER